MNHENLATPYISYLQTLDACTVTGMGLQNGKTGLLLLYYALFRYTGHPHWEEKAQMMLDEVGENIGAVASAGFYEGLSGIGWSLEWLAQGGFVEANTDEVLEEVDNVLYKAMLQVQAGEGPLKDGVLGMAAYFLKRFEAANYGVHRYRRIVLQECLVILTDELCNRDFNALPANDVADAIIFLSRLCKHNIHMEAVEAAMLRLALLAQKLLLSGALQLADGFKTAYGLWLLGDAYRCRKWQAQAKQWLAGAVCKPGSAVWSRAATHGIVPAGKDPVFPDAAIQGYSLMSWGAFLISEMDRQAAGTAWDDLLL